MAALANSLTLLDHALAYDSLRAFIFSMHFFANSLSLLNHALAYDACVLEPSTTLPHADALDNASKNFAQRFEQSCWIMLQPHMLTMTLGTASYACTFRK